MSYMDMVGDHFTSTGTSQRLPIKIGFDWMSTFNYTAFANQVNNAVTKTYWQRGMAANNCLMEYFNAGSTAILHATALNFPGGAKPGYIEYSSGNNLYSNNYTNLLAPAAVSAISAANPGVVTTADIVTPALANGDIVRFSNTNPQVGQFGGIDFTVGAVTGTGGNTGTFTLPNGPVVVAGAAMGAFYRKVVYDTPWVPRKRYISRILRGATTIITMTVTHDFIVGEKVRIHIPSVRGSTAFGTVEMDNMIGTVTAINVDDTVTAGGVYNTITLDINSAAFTAFAWPLTAFDRFTAPTVCPIGEDATDTFSRDTITDDAVINTATTGIILGGNATVVSPVGVANDLIYWRAGNFWSSH